MKMKICSYYNVKGKFYNNIKATTDSEETLKIGTIRYLKQLSLTDRAGKDQWDLHIVGTFDDESGKITPCKPYLVISQADALLQIAELEEAEEKNAKQNDKPIQG